MIVIGTSLGGMRALQKIFSALPADFSQPIAVVIHRQKETDDFLTEYLQKACVLPISEVVDKEPIVGGRIYFAPADYHLLVEPDHFDLSIDEHVQFARPSIDVLFESAADVFGKKAIGVILTGANRDGARGVESIQDRGGIVVVENPQTATCATMPTAAIKAASSSYICDLNYISPLLVSLISRTASQ